MLTQTLFFFLFITHSYSLSFSFDLNGKDDICFEEFFSTNTLVVGEFDIPDEKIPLFSVKILNPKQEIIFDKRFDIKEPKHVSKLEKETKIDEINYQDDDDKENEIIKINEKSTFTNESDIYSEHKGALNLIKFNFATFDDGAYKICVFNDGLSKLRIHISLKTGVEAKDYSVFSKKQELEELAKETFLIKQTADFIRTDYNAISDLEIYKIYLAGSISQNIVWFSISTTLIIIIISVVQYVLVKNFFRRKKMI